MFGIATLIAVTVCFLTYVHQIHKVGSDSCRNETAKAIATTMSPVVSGLLQQAGLNDDATDVNQPQVKAALEILEQRIPKDSMMLTLASRS